MKLENSFTVEAPAEAAWDLLMDVPRIIPRMPGAHFRMTLRRGTAPDAAPAAAP